MPADEDEEVAPSNDIFDLIPSGAREFHPRACHPTPHRLCLASRRFAGQLAQYDIMDDGDDMDVSLEGGHAKRAVFILLLASAPPCRRADKLSATRAGREK